MASRMTEGFYSELTKLAKESKDKKEITGKDVAVGVGGAVAGAKGVTKLRRLHGRDPMHHGSSEDRVRDIVRDGLKPQHKSGVTDAVDKSSIGRAVHGSDKLQDRNKGLSFMTKSESKARGYGYQQRKLNEGKTHADFQNATTARQFAHASHGFDPKSKREVATADVPMWKLKKQKRLVENPEASRARQTHGSAAAWAVKKLTGADHGIKGGVEGKYFRGNKDYQKPGFKDVKDFAKGAPKQFAGRAAAGVAGVTAAGLAARHLYKKFRKNKETA